MKGLLGRMIASYIALAVIALAGAGVLLESLLSARLTEADEADLRLQVEGAARLASLVLLQNPDRQADAIETEVRRTYPSVRVVPTEAIGPSAAWVVYESSAVQIPAYQQAMVVTRGLVYALTDRPRERIVQVEEDGRIRIALRVYWEDGTHVRTVLLRRGLVGAGLMALAVAVVMAVWFGRTLTAPLNRMAQAAGQLAEGEWNAPLPTSGPREIRALSAAFQAMASRLEADFRQLESDREKLQHLTAELAHELKTPIASLRTYHEILLDGEERPDRRQELLTRGAAQVARLEYLVHFLVDMARLECHAEPLNLQEAELGALAGQAVAAVQPRAGQKGLMVRLHEPDRPVPVLADPQRVGQALDNLLQNACHCTPEGGTIVVAVEQAGANGRVTVSDDGPGIAEDLLPRLFTPFARGPGSRGLGLGLAIVRAVAQSHGGTVAAANRPEGGARFMLEIPLQGAE